MTLWLGKREKRWTFCNGLRGRLSFRFLWHTRIEPLPFHIGGERLAGEAHVLLSHSHGLKSGPGGWPEKSTRRGNPPWNYSVEMGGGEPVCFRHLITECVNEGWRSHAHSSGSWRARILANSGEECWLNWHLTYLASQHQSAQHRGVRILVAGDTTNDNVAVVHFISGYRYMVESRILFLKASLCLMFIPLNGYVFHTVK